MRCRRCRPVVLCRHGGADQAGTQAGPGPADTLPGSLRYPRCQPEQRAQVSRLMAANCDSAPAPREATPTGSPERNCPRVCSIRPISLAFQPRIDHIDASNKFHVAFEWDGERLKSVKPSFENAAHATGEKTISFGYEDHVPQVVWASDGDQARPRRARRSRRSVQTLQPCCCSTVRLWIPWRSSASPGRTWRWRSPATGSLIRSYGRSSTTSGSDLRR